jgi:aldehyde dehydrogenase (NAD+)
LRVSITSQADLARGSVVNGGVEETTALLELQWDHIFYIGNSRIARVIAAAAAKHLTPVSLELGGKSPALVDGTFDAALAAKRILWGKTQNAGQICVTADYVLVERTQEAALIAGLKDAYAAAFPGDGGALHSPSFASIVNERHFDRIKQMLDDTKGEVVLGGRTDRAKLRFEPTVVRGVGRDDSTMQACVPPHAPPMPRPTRAQRDLRAHPAHHRR